MKIINKPWGKEEILEINKNYMIKKLTMFKGHRCSLQYHNKKTETIYVLKGKLRIYSGTSENSLTSKIYYPNDFVTINAKTVHRMEGVEEVLYLESSSPEIDDVVRLSDDYNRSKS